MTANQDISGKDNNTPLLARGKNCWQIEEVEKAAFLVDADSYFKAFRQAVIQARQTVFICGWDIDSRLALLREDPGDGYPLRLRDFLNEAADRRDGLQIYILLWDFAMLLGLNREWFPIYNFDWKTHRNVHLAMDDLHPVGGSHHQKIVVIDDVLAFAGGLDLTKRRWDTPAHKPDDENRRSPDGELYRPHHDIQMMVQGMAAADLGGFFRQRWEFVTRHTIDTGTGESRQPLWPDIVTPDIVGCNVGIARTRAGYEEIAPVREVEQLYLDTISKAQKYIYIENQYLTSPKISGALAESLRREKGPEIIIVLPATTDGWLSQHTMDLLRYRAVQQMREADRYNRLGIFYAHQKGLEGAEDIKIHAKLMIADDILVRIGSANLNNRSMGLDTEIDLALETDGGHDQQKAVADLCSRLLAEHLGVSQDVVEKTRHETGSLLQTVNRQQGNDRTLRRLEVQIDETVELVVEEQYLLDPEEPIDPDRLIEQWLPLEKIEDGGFNKIGLLLLLTAGIGLGLAWRFTPLHEMISGEQLQTLVDFLKTSRLSWLYVAGAYIFGSILIVPLTALIVGTILIYGSVKGFIFAILGACVSGAITYWLGRLLGRNTVRKLAGDKVNRLSKKLGKSGVFSTFIIRFMPIAPYSIVNIVAGATHIRFRDFILGTFLGLLPGILAIAGLIDRGFALFTNPGPMTFFSMTAVIAVVGIGYFFLQRKVREQE